MKRLGMLRTPRDGGTVAHGFMQLGDGCERRVDGLVKRVPGPGGTR